MGLFSAFGERFGDARRGRAPLLVENLANAERPAPPEGPIPPERRGLCVAERHRRSSSRKRVRCAEEW
jgi:hypothetical protein